MNFELQIVNESLKVFPKSAIPALQFTVKYNLREDILPLGIKGSVFSQDDKFLTNLVELPPIDVMNNQAPGMEESSEVSNISYISKQPTNIITHENHMLFTLDKKALDYIEERRHQTKNQDVIFTFYITLSVLILQ